VALESQDIRDSSAHLNKEMTMAAKTLDKIKPRAKVDPKGAALVKKMKDVARQAKDSEHVGSIRIMPKNLPPSDSCACMCMCS
jgi:hypothetical protein